MPPSSAANASAGDRSRLGAGLGLDEQKGFERVFLLDVGIRRLEKIKIVGDGADELLGIMLPRLDAPVRSDDPATIPTGGPPCRYGPGIRFVRGSGTAPASPRSPGGRSSQARQPCLLATGRPGSGRSASRIGRGGTRSRQAFHVDPRRSHGGLDRSPIATASTEVRSVTSGSASGASGSTNCTLRASPSRVTNRNCSPAGT